MITMARMHSVKSAFRPSRRNLPPLVLCLAVIAVFIFWLLLPLIRQNHALEAQVGERREQIQVQRALHPVHHELRALLDGPLPLGVDLEDLDHESTLALESAAPHVQALAESAGLQVRFIRPDASALARDGVLLLDSAMSGDVPRLLNFLREISPAPWMLDVQSLEISSSHDGEEFRLRLRIAMDRD
ncbi:hypothetical protein [Desulfonatronum thioautotrophicum]|uniref:hypothetical protein n=1 Tax=Desulfonatronum thioautotrophicum TaxID=617001 RepID=UPI0005EB520D|nr:hypothetical protein [Desulfonatronum thioautotrophicum]